MLESLDAIPWGRLRCQTGFAGHVPDAVRGLLSDDAEDVEAAYRRLDNFVVVQGSIYEAAEYLLRTEPHSPTPYLVKRAVEWGSMSLFEVFQQIIRNEGEMQEIAGQLMNRFNLH